MWIAGKKQRIKRDGEYIWVEPGDPVPEAENWPNRASWERQGYIRLVGRRAHAEQVASVAAGVAVRRQAAKRPEKPPMARNAEAPKAKATPEQSGPGVCKWCGGDYRQLEKHRCKMRPTEEQIEEPAEE